ncbi:hypothetical protein G7Z17_g8459 [Cylindrodendrum hubeiense]|uniref:Uncharacterized protein n=1 Tax=Cylindrodendrum hubeiense TaxID=595255 RepID=A0A9P5L904_9HYPO|nr:hypothetical protein G7Z17_g8459 [Cylindrodendrum hubeiense]
MSGLFEAVVHQTARSRGPMARRLTTNQEITFCRLFMGVEETQAECPSNQGQILPQESSTISWRALESAESTPQPLADAPGGRDILDTRMQGGTWSHTARVVGVE